MFSYHVKLHPGIIYSHPRGTTIKVPALTVRCEPSEQQLFLTFELTQLRHDDWNYPFDLCGAFYRTVDIQNLLSCCTAADLASPNNFEVSGNQIFFRSFFSKPFFRCACPTNATASIITINRVQSTYEVPIYENDGLTLEVLNNYIVCVAKDNLGRSSASASALEMQIDCSRYLYDIRLSAHIGDVHMTIGSSNFQSQLFLGPVVPWVTNHVLDVSSVS